MHEVPIECRGRRLPVGQFSLVVQTRKYVSQLINLITVHQRNLFFGGLDRVVPTKSML